MNVKLSKVFLSFVLAIATCLSIGSVAFAADSSTSASPSDAAVNASEAVPMSVGTYDSGIIPSGGELTLYPTLNSYVGLTRKFFLITENIYSDTTPSGTIQVYIYKPDGNLLKYDVVGPNQDDYYYTVTLPPAGTYTVKLISHVNERIYASAGWTT